MSSPNRTASFLALALSLALAGAAGASRAEAPAPSEKHRGHDYPGAQHFYFLDRATVVYPAGRGQDVERNRRSAAARAAFLEAQTGMATRVVADVEISAEHLSDNLLILGWDNALLGTESIPRPFEETPDRPGRAPAPARACACAIGSRSRPP